MILLCSILTSTFLDPETSLKRAWKGHLLRDPITASDEKLSGTVSCNGAWPRPFKIILTSALFEPQPYPKGGSKGHLLVDPIIVIFLTTSTLTSAQNIPKRENQKRSCRESFFCHGVWRKAFGLVLPFAKWFFASKTYLKERFKRDEKALGGRPYHCDGIPNRLVEWLFFAFNGCPCHCSPLNPTQKRAYKGLCWKRLSIVVTVPDNNHLEKIWDHINKCFFAPKPCWKKLKGTCRKTLFLRCCLTTGNKRKL